MLDDDDSHSLSDDVMSKEVKKKSRQHQRVLSYPQFGEDWHATSQSSIGNTHRRSLAAGMIGVGVPKSRRAKKEAGHEQLETCVSPAETSRI